MTSQPHPDVEPGDVAELDPIVAAMRARTTRDLLGDVLQLQAAAAALEAMTSDLRDELSRRAKDTLATDGVAPTWRAPGLGSAVLTDPQPKRAVTNPPAFGAWAAEHYPSEVVAQLAVSGEVLPAVIETLTDGGLWGEVTLVLQPRAAWSSTLLDKGCELVDDELFDQALGVPVPGAGVRPAGPNVLQIRLDADAKAAAVTEAATIGMALLEHGVGALAVRDLTPAVAAGIDVDLDADGVPDYDGSTYVVETVDLETPADPAAEGLTPAALAAMTVAQLRVQADRLEVDWDSKLRKADLVERLTNRIGSVTP